MIEKQTVEVAVCDAGGCGQRMYADTHGEFSAGYELTIVEYSSDPAGGASLQAFACRTSHIGKAAKTILAKWHDTESEGGEDGDAWDAGDRELADRDLTASPR